MKKFAIASLSLLLATVAMGFEIHHANMRDAYGEADNAIRHVQLAQANNKGIEFGGHTENAIGLLRHAQQELVEGDKFNDMHHR